MEILCSRNGISSLKNGNSVFRKWKLFPLPWKVGFSVIVRTKRGKTMQPRSSQNSTLNSVIAESQNPGGADYFTWATKMKHVYPSYNYLQQVANTGNWMFFQAMEKCVDEGLVKSIGLSNFNSIQIQEILDNCRIKPVNVQVTV